MVLRAQLNRIIIDYSLLFYFSTDKTERKIKNLRNNSKESKVNHGNNIDNNNLLCVLTN